MRLRYECSCKFTLSLLFFYSSFFHSSCFFSFISTRNVELKTGDWKFYIEERPSILLFFNLFGFGITANRSWLMRYYRARTRALISLNSRFAQKRSNDLPARESDSRNCSRLRFVTFERVWSFSENSSLLPLWIIILFVIIPTIFFGSILLRC